MKIGIIMKEENLSFFVWHFIMAVFGSRKVSRKEINIKENCCHVWFHYRKYKENKI